MDNTAKRFSISRPIVAFQVHNLKTIIEYKTGQYISKYGIVLIYAQKDYADLRFSHNGQYYVQSFSELKKPMSERALVIRASNLAKNVVQNESFDIK